MTAAAPHHPRALTAERRSPTADAHDPPALKAHWTVEQDAPLDAFLQDVRERVADDERFERLLRHGGLHLDRRRLCDFAEPPAVVRAGTAVAAYWFVREPVPLALDAGRVIFDEHGLVAIDKPAWWTTQGTRASRFASLERALREALGCPALTPVNRIDRETTGVLLFARDSRAASEAGKQLIARTVRKEYLAVVDAASPPEAAFEVRGRMVRVEHPSHSLFALREDPAATEGEWSATRFETLTISSDEHYSAPRALVLARPLTGRTHQLRVHLASRRLPILGDSLYGSGWTADEPGSPGRMLLHARALTLKVGGAERRIEAPIPPDFPPLQDRTA